MAKRGGRSYEKRAADVNRIYDQYASSGLSNREIWRRYIYPVYAVSERSFYNMLKTVSPPPPELMDEGFLFIDFFKKEDERRRNDYFKKNI